MKNRITLLALFIIIAIAVLVGASISRGARKSPPSLAQPAPTGTAFDQPPNVQFSFAAPPSIPTSLPTYQFGGATLSSVEQAAQRATTALGLETVPSVLQMTDAYTKTWSRPNEAALTVTQTTSGITLSFQQAIAQKGQTQKQPANAAGDFLSLFFTSAPGVSIEQTSVLSGPFDGLLVLDPPDPPQYQAYNFRYAIGGYAIITAGFGYDTASIVVDGAGAIRSANITPPPSSIQRVGTVDLLLVDQILLSLSAGRGVAVDAHNPESASLGEKPAFSSFTIEDVKIVYAPQGSQLLPALLLSGTGAGSGGLTQRATFFLWAFPSGIVAAPF